jgi:hypothetical protein
MRGSVTQIPRRGFARGAVVREKEGGPNMLVVRQLDQMTACFLIETGIGVHWPIRHFRP